MCSGAVQIPGVQPLPHRYFVTTLSHAPCVLTSEVQRTIKRAYRVEGQASLGCRAQGLSPESSTSDLHLAHWECSMARSWGEIQNFSSFHQEFAVWSSRVSLGKILTWLLFVLAAFSFVHSYIYGCWIRIPLKLELASKTNGKQSRVLQYLGISRTQVFH